MQIQTNFILNTSNPNLGMFGHIEIVKPNPDFRTYESTSRGVFTWICNKKTENTVDQTRIQTQTPLNLQLGALPTEPTSHRQLIPSDDHIPSSLNIKFLHTLEDMNQGSLSLSSSGNRLPKICVNVLYFYRTQNYHFSIDWFLRKFWKCDKSCDNLLLIEVLRTRKNFPLQVIGHAKVK